MPITLKPNRMYVKNNGQYQSITVISDKTTQQQIQQITNAKDTAVAQMNQIKESTASNLQTVQSLKTQIESYGSNYKQQLDTAKTTAVNSITSEGQSQLTNINTAASSAKTYIDGKVAYIDAQFEDIATKSAEAKSAKDDAVSAKNESVSAKVQAVSAVESVNKVNFSVSKTGNTATITATDKTGSVTTATVTDGVNGTDGTDGTDGDPGVYLQDTAPTEEGAKVWLKSNGTQTVKLLTESDIPSVPVKGVQVAGTDLTPDANGKVNVPVASTANFGAVKYYATDYYGIVGVAGGYTAIKPASSSEISARNEKYKPIIPSSLNSAVKSALTDSKRIGHNGDAGLTSAEQDNACAVIGAVRDKGEWVLKGTITTDTKASGATLDLTGCTQLLIRGNGTATGTVNLVWGNDEIVLCIAFTTTYKSFVNCWENDAFGYHGVYGYRGIVASNDNPMAIANVSVSLFDGSKIDNMQNIKFNNPSNVTTCNIEIYAR